MSDLIEKLKAAKKRLKGYPNPEECFTKFILDLSEIKTLLSALETVRGIEEIMQKDTHLSIYRGGFKYYVQVRNSDRGVDFMRRVPVEEGPSAAIEAARKGM